MVGVLGVGLSRWVVGKAAQRLMRVLATIILFLSSPSLMAGSWVLVESSEPVVSFSVDGSDVMTDDYAIIGAVDPWGFASLDWGEGAVVTDVMSGDRVRARRVSDNKVYDIFSRAEFHRYEASLSGFYVAGVAVGVVVGGVLSMSVFRLRVRV